MLNVNRLNMPFKRQRLSDWKLNCMLPKGNRTSTSKHRQIFKIRLRRYIPCEPNCKEGESWSNYIDRRQRKL
jgi:hypothetical protein